MSVTEQAVDSAKAFAAELVELAEHDPRICIVLNDSAETHFAEEFERRFPERIFDVGIAEQTMVGVAAGLANGGRVPFVHSASCFLTARALEQIKADAAYSDNNIKLCGFVSGMAYGALGGTHHAIEDLAWMRVIPNLAVIAPGSAVDAAAAARMLVAHEGPVFVRLCSKMPVVEFLPTDHEFVLGRAVRVREGSDVALVGTGLMTSRLLAAADLLEAGGMSVRVVHMGSISPIDEAELVAAARDCGRLVVAEDHVVSGGLAGAVAEVLVRTRPAPVLSIGVPDVFAPVGPTGWLYEHFGLTAETMAPRIAAWAQEAQEAG